jgi:hypothetical protein
MAVLRTTQAGDQTAFDTVGTNMTKIRSLEFIERASRACKSMCLIANFEDNQQIRRVKMHMLLWLFEGPGRIIQAKKAPKWRPLGNEESL